jgi:hypothetical protein
LQSSVVKVDTAHSQRVWFVQTDGLTTLLVGTERSHVMTYESKFTQWRKSSRSSGGDNCVEIAIAGDGSIGVRDSKQHGRGPVLEFTPSEWDAFVGGVKDGEFDQR